MMSLSGRLEGRKNEISKVKRRLTSMAKKKTKYDNVFVDNKDSLDIYLDGMHKFDRAFCDAMMDGSDFTIKLEMRGNKGELIHCLVDRKCFRRPAKVDEDQQLRDRGVAR